MYAIMCFMKWSWNTRTFMTLGSLFGSMVTSILVKSTCKRSIGAVDTIGCRGTVDNLPICCKQCEQAFRVSVLGQSFPATRNIPTARTGYTHTLDDLHLSDTHSEQLHSVPWGPQRAGDLQFHLWASKCRYKASWEIETFCQFHKISLCYSLEACSAKSVFRLVCFCTCSQSSTVLNVRSSLWALAQLVTCISTSGQPAVTCTSFSKHQLPSIMARSCTLA